MSSSLIAQAALTQSNRSSSALHLCQLSIRSRGYVWAFSRDGLTLLFLDQIWRMMTTVISSMTTWTQTLDLTWAFMISDLCLRCCPVTSVQTKSFATLRHFFLFVHGTGWFDLWGSVCSLNLTTKIEMSRMTQTAIWLLPFVIPGERKQRVESSQNMATEVHTYCIIQSSHLLLLLFLLGVELISVGNC